MAVNQLIRSAIECERPNPRYAYVAPLYKQAKAIAWDYMKTFTRPVPGVQWNESELRVDLPGNRRITLLGADNADALRGIYLDGVVLDEYAFMHPDVFRAVIRPALVDRQGFAIFLGTPLGRNHFHELYQRARQQDGMIAELYRASETDVVPDEELRAAALEMTPEQYAQEFECSFDAAIQGAYYARELEQCRAAGRIRAVPYEPQLPVDTYWDLGWNDSTAIGFVQRIGREIHVIDYVEDRNKNLQHYAQLLQNRGYVYGKHYLPHDVEVTELGSGRTRKDILQTLGVRPVMVLGRNEPMDGINQARLLFARVWFDEQKCRGLIEALSSYRADWDDKHRVFKDQPLHDWASHGADMFRYLAIAQREVPVEARERIRPAKLQFDPVRVAH